MSMARRRSGGIGNRFLQVVGYILLAAVILALLRTFDMDPFGVIDWLWSWLVSIVTRISDWLMNNEVFREITDKPN